MTDDLLKSAKAVALRQLARRRRTRFELDKYLHGKGYPAAVREAVLDLMADYGYINDAEYSRLWALGKIGKRGFRRLRYDLKEKGVSSEIIEDVFRELDPDLEFSSALGLVAKELRRSDGGRGRQKIFSSLHQRGYSGDVINKIQNMDLDEVLEYRHDQF
jgi:regulatory protein